MQAKLESAYQAAWYHLWWPGGSERIHSGQWPRVFLQHHHHQGDEPWFWLTAANPGSRLLPAHCNRLRNLLLALELRRRGWLHGPGWSGSPHADWPVEAGFWLICSRPAAVHALARHFGQLAVLQGSRHQPARVHWLDAEESPH